MAELPDDVRRLFEGANYAHLATLMPDGGPHSVPVCVVVEGGRLAFLTTPDSLKVRNLERDPRVSISVVDHERPSAMAQVQGRIAERLDGPRALEMIDRISQKYTGRPSPVRTGRIVLLVEPEHAWAQTYG